MEQDEYGRLFREISNDAMNAELAAKGYQPVYQLGPGARIAIVSQAPGRKAQASGIPWDDVSGRLLRSWLGVSDQQFYDPSLFAILPIDFYYPGKGNHGDLPPRVEFARKWQPRVFELLPDVELVILVGSYAQKFYLAREQKANLTATVQNFADYLPRYFPLVHPSPLNLGWRARNPWFETEVIAELRQQIKRIIT